MKVLTQGSATRRGTVCDSRRKLPHQGTKAQLLRGRAARTAIFAGEDQIPPPAATTASGANLERAASGRLGTYRYVSSLVLNPAPTASRARSNVHDRNTVCP